MTSFSFGTVKTKKWKISLIKSIKGILTLNLIKNIQSQKNNSSAFWFTKMNNRGYKQLYLRRTQINNLIFMQNMTTQCHSKKYTVQSNTASQKSLFNKQLIRAQLYSSLQKEVMTILRLKPKLRTLNF